MSLKPNYQAIVLDPIKVGENLEKITVRVLDQAGLIIALDPATTVGAQIEVDGRNPRVRAGTLESGPEGVVSYDPDTADTALSGLLHIMLYYAQPNLGRDVCGEIWCPIEVPIAGTLTAALTP